MLQFNESPAQAVKEQSVNLHSSESTMSSLEIAQFTRKNHFDLLKAIRKMEHSWTKINGSKFALVEYVDTKGEKRPAYNLTKTECLYVMARFNDEIRAKLVLRWKELEEKEHATHQPEPQNGWLYYKNSCRRISLSTDSGAYWKRMQNYPNEFDHDETGRALISSTFFLHLKKSVELRSELKQIASRNPKHIETNTQQLSLFDDNERISLLTLATQIEDTNHRMSIVNKLLGGSGK